MEGGYAGGLSRPRGVVQVHCEGMEASPKGRQRQRRKRWRRKLEERLERPARGPEDDPIGEEREEEERGWSSSRRPAERNPSGVL